MTITIRRLDCPGTISAMIAIVNRHALLADGARQQALDEIARSLNNIDAIIARHKLAPLLAATIPPIPPRYAAADDDDLVADDLVDEDAEEDDETPPSPPPATKPAPTTAPATRPAGDDTGLTPAPTRLLRYIQNHPGSSAVEIQKGLTLGRATLDAHLVAIRKAGYIIDPQGKPARYRLVERADG